MAANGLSSRELRAEAKLLQYLFQSYLNDKSYTAPPGGGRILYFIDSHDLKSYIDPDDPTYMNGFVFLVEQMRRLRRHDESFELEMKLKSEQLLHQALFSSMEQTGLLPSHAEEIDEEIAFRQSKWVTDKIDLLDEARRHVRGFFTKYISIGDIKASASDSAAKRRLVEFFREAAPALMTLLRPSSADPMVRMHAVVEDSNLVAVGQLKWERFGYSDEQCVILRNISLDYGRVEYWRSYLSDRRANTQRSNRIDAEALAYLEILNATTAELGAPALRALMITRAMSLVSAVNSHGGANFLRHPRLMVLPSPDGDRDYQNQRRYEVDGNERQSEEALFVALQTYRRHLKAQDRSAEQISDQELEYASDKLADAWDAFERARFTIGLRSGRTSEGDEATIDGEFQALVSWLRNDVDVLTLVEEGLLRAINQFGRATFALGHGQTAGPIKARVLVMTRPTRCRVIPLASGVPFLIEFRAPTLGGPQPHYSDITSVLSDLEGTLPERYLAWAMLLACHKRWKLAEIYAKSAINVSRLATVPRRDGEWTRNEARLLRAQVLRLSSLEWSAGKDSGAIHSRYRSTEQSLARITRTSDPRVPFEQAAQLLEYRLTAGAGRPEWPSLQSGYDSLRTALDLASDDEVVQIRVLALGVAYNVAALAHPTLWPELSGDQYECLETWHRRLHELLTEERKSFGRNEVSFRARAMELLGFQKLFPARGDSDGKSEMRIPAPLRLDVFDIYDEIKQGADATAKLIASELEEIVRWLDQHRPRDLIYAPIWAPYEYERIVRLVPEQLQASVGECYDTLRRIAGSSQKLGIQGRDRVLLTQIAARFDGAVKQLAGMTQGADRSGEASFYLRMEACYARLLLTSTSALWPEGRGELEGLAQRYREISADFPDASIPHFRLDVILGKVGRVDEALKEAHEALNLISSDPFIHESEHWVRSTMKRRVAGWYMEEGEALREKLEENASDTKCRERYVELVKRALQIVYSNYQLEIFPDRDDLHRLETRRRINNIVYYTSLLFEVEPKGSYGAGISLDPSELRDLLARLHPEGIESVTEVNIAHTIGHAYAVLGDIGNAVLAARRVMNLLGEAGGDPKRDRGVAKVVADALRWFGLHADRAELRWGDLGKPVKA